MCVYRYLTKHMNTHTDVGMINLQSKQVYILQSIHTQRDWGNDEYTHRESGGMINTHTETGAMITCSQNTAGMNCHKVYLETIMGENWSK